MKKLLIAIVMLYAGAMSAQTFDFRCGPPNPSDFLTDDPYHWYWSFVRDALDYGMDFTEEVGVIEVMDNADYNGSYLNESSAVSVNSCGDGYEIYIKRSQWDGKTTEWKRFLIYHELGHALLERAHVCNPGIGDPRNNGRTNFVERDIMFTPAPCEVGVTVNTNGNYSFNGNRPWEWHYQINMQIIRLFENTEQEQLTSFNCGVAGKGRNLIYD